MSESQGPGSGPQQQQPPSPPPQPRPIAPATTTAPTAAAPAGAPAPRPPPQQPAAPKEPPARIKALADAIKQKFPGAAIDYIREKRLKVTVSPETIKSAALFVRDELGFDHLGVVSGTDYMAKKEIEVVYFVGSLSREGYRDVVIGIAERQKRENPTVESLIGVWPAAEYHERETFEMLGVNFQGHPDLRRLLLPEDWNDLPPLRKDYNSPGR